MPTQSDLRALVIAKAGGEDQLGPNVRRRMEYGYYLPAEVYECIIAQRVTSETVWLDVGGGKTVFPDNPGLTRVLAERCRRLVAVDPSDNILQNRVAQETHQCVLEDLNTSERFDLITMRMVVEHVANPQSFMTKIYELLNPGGTAIALTVWKYAPVSLAANLIPFSLHHSIKAIIWGTLQEDSFPTQYRLNTWKEQLQHCERVGLQLGNYLRQNDCSVTLGLGRFAHVELFIERLMRAMRIPYPEHCTISEFIKADTQ